MGDKGVIASTAGLAHPAARGDRRHDPRLAHPEPGAPREREVEIAQQVLQSMGLRSFLPPGLGLPGLRSPRRRSSRWRSDPGLQGPDAGVEGDSSGGRRPARGGDGLRGERPGRIKARRHRISLPGTFEEPVAPVFIDGRLDRTLRGEGLVDEFIAILEDYVAQRFPAPAVRPRADPAPTRRRPENALGPRCSRG